jgi:competence protein ComEA
LCSIEVSKMGSLFWWQSFIILQLIYFFVPFSSEAAKDPGEEEIVEQMQRSIDSLKKLEARKDSVPLAPFNPNFISDYKGFTLGMKPGEIDRLHEYRQQGLWVNSAEEFQEVTGVSDSLLKLLAPSFNFPDFRRGNTQNDWVSKNAFSTPLIKGDLNAATADELRKVNGIGEKLSARIINYRNSIGGFRGDAQLKDVYGLSPEVIDRLLSRFEVKVTAEKIDINSVPLMQLVEIPYFNYEQARALVKYREEVGNISNFEELRQRLTGFRSEKIDRIKLYLTLK